MGISIIVVLVIITLALLALFFKKFTNVNITRSNKRNPLPYKVQLPHNITLTTWGAVFIKSAFGSSDFFPASFMLEAQGKVICIDPLLIDDPRSADYILITHAHPDHFSLSDIEKLATKDTIIICPKQVDNRLSAYQTKVVKPGDLLNLGKIKCEAIAAYSLGFPSHPKWNHNVGYILTINGERIYHAGDTDLIPELKNIKDITIAMVPIDGDNLTMKTEEFMQLIDKDISVHQSNISTVPVSPLTLTICPSFNKSVAEGIPTTAGIPYSLATIPP